jgi:RNA polymerase sigma-70 factor (ECF subfamily)
MKAAAAMLDEYALKPGSEADAGALSGGEAEFSGLYHQHQPALYRFLLQLGARPQVAEELVQEVFLAWLRRPGNYQPTRGSLRAYLLGIGRRLLRRHWRRHRLEILWNPLAPEPNDGGRAAAALDAQQSFDGDSRWLQTALAALPWRYREAVVLCDLQEISYAQAAQILHCRSGTVASRRHRGHKLLQVRLEQRRRREKCG